jgi:hypothetical protein
MCRDRAQGKEKGWGRQGLYTLKLRTDHLALFVRLALVTGVLRADANRRKRLSHKWNINTLCILLPCPASPSLSSPSLTGSHPHAAPSPSLRCIFPYCLLRRPSCESCHFSVPSYSGMYFLFYFSHPYSNLPLSQIHHPLHACRNSRNVAAPTLLAPGTSAFAFVSYHDDDSASL